MRDTERVLHPGDRIVRLPEVMDRAAGGVAHDIAASRSNPEKGQERGTSDRQATGSQ
ncbi:MAG: hypothetical protein OXC68_12705 [Aestuariivita sp.]|nr:hypothetical protein [Aestuariivita sp.]